MVKRWLTPSHMTDQDLTLNFKVKIQHAHGQKMIDPPVWQTRISPKILKLRFNVHMVKRWLTPSHMTDQDLTLNFKVEIQHAHGQKMIDPPVWQTRISPRILKLRFDMHMVKRCLTPQVWLTRISARIWKISARIWKFRFSLHMVKDDWPPFPPQFDRPGSHLEI